jgi:hypothetical protein
MGPQRVFGRPCLKGTGCAHAILGGMPQAHPPHHPSTAVKQGILFVFLGLLVAVGTWLALPVQQSPPTESLRYIQRPLSPLPNTPESGSGQVVHRLEDAASIRPEVEEWRLQLAATLPLFDQYCASAHPTRLACEGDLCAYRHSMGRRHESEFERFRRNPRAFAESVAVAVGLPPEVSRCHLATRAVPWRPSNLGPSRQVASDSPDLSCFVMGFDWTEPRHDLEVQRSGVRMCNALAREAGHAANYERAAAP